MNTKSLIVAALLAASTMASAETVMVMANKSGGKVVLTKQECRVDAEWQAAYAFSGRTGERVEACWFYLDKKVHVVFGAPFPPDQAHKTYPLSDFKLEDF